MKENTFKKFLRVNSLFFYFIEMVIKRYLILNKLTTSRASDGTYSIKLPNEFYNSNNKNKFIHFLHASAEVNNVMISNLSFHSTFVQQSPDYDGFVAMCNVDYSKIKKWNLYYNIEGFSFHFRTFDGIKLNDSDLNFIVELLLEF